MWRESICLQRGHALISARSPELWPGIILLIFQTGIFWIMQEVISAYPKFQWGYDHQFSGRFFPPKARARLGIWSLGFQAKGRGENQVSSLTLDSQNAQSLTSIYTLLIKSKHLGERITNSPGGKAVYSLGSSLTLGGFIHLKGNFYHALSSISKIFHSAKMSEMEVPFIWN